MRGMKWKPWLVGAIALCVGVAFAIAVGPDADFYRSLAATFIGAALGFLVALYIDRLQRTEAERARRATDDASEQREKARESELARDRRVAILSLLRSELGRVPNQMAARQDRNHLPNDSLTDILWRSLSASGELRWIQELDLLRQVASAYDLVAVEIEMERRWLEARAVSGGSKTASEDFISNQLKLHDRDSWRLACQACKAMDVALAADGGEVGSDLFCP